MNLKNGILAALMRNTSEQQPMYDQYNTELTPEEYGQFLQWCEEQGRDPIEETRDYDLQGAFKAALTNDPRGHLGDSFKKPNHSTFSDQSTYASFENPGGYWDEETLQFVPGSQNQRNPDSLYRYITHVESASPLQDFGSLGEKWADGVPGMESKQNWTLNPMLNEYRIKGW